MGWTPPVLGATVAHWSSLAWGSDLRAKGVRHECYDHCGRSGKTVFQLAEADDNWQIVRTHRLTRRQFERFFANRHVKLVIMEACGSAHYWARWFDGLSITVKLLPPRHVRRYVLGNKTDAADCAALLEAARNPNIRPVRIKGVEQRPCRRCIGFAASG